MRFLGKRSNRPLLALFIFGAITPPNGVAQEYLTSAQVRYAKQLGSKTTKPLTLGTLVQGPQRDGIQALILLPIHRIAYEISDAASLGKEVSPDVNLRRNQVRIICFPHGSQHSRGISLLRPQTEERMGPNSQKLSLGEITALFDMDFVKAVSNDKEELEIVIRNEDGSERLPIRISLITLQQQQR